MTGQPTAWEPLTWVIGAPGASTVGGLTHGRTRSAGHDALVPPGPVQDRRPAQPGAGDPADARHRDRAHVPGDPRPAPRRAPPGARRPLGLAIAGAASLTRPSR